MSELVSVIIPVYNSAQFLKESLESVINQTYSNIEIICVNDGSTDNSLKILQQYSDKITIVSQENHGLASALNLGICTMKGIWFKWFSPDDVMFPYAIETLVNVAKKYSNTIVYSNWKIIDENGNELREFQESNYNKLSNFEYNIRLLDKQLINVNTTLIPSCLLENFFINNLDDPVTIDYNFFLHSALLSDTNFHLILKPTIKYRIHSDQLSHKNISKTMESISKIKNEILIQLDDSIRMKYLDELGKYQKTKSTKQKTMEFGMKILSSAPSCVSDRILIFYLNKIRQNR
jgi:glycosyltransferase involved in cell wall biosynthesis|tara:strand:+ start:57 stop:929 length:873 start_codon:yes stop_codon:yes gene_type:complete